MLHEEQPIWEAKGKSHNRPVFFIALFIALLPFFTVFFRVKERLEGCRRRVVQQ